MASEKAEVLKEEGNRHVTEGNYNEALIHYTHAIQVDPKAYQIYSNRSFAFLKLKQYYLAYQDAISAIRLNPEWPKGYFRKAEVEFATSNFEDAFESYTKAFALQSNNSDLFEYIVKCQQKIAHAQKTTMQLQWISAGVGFILGTLLVLGDVLLTDVPVMNHPVIQAGAILSMAAAAYFLACFYSKYKKSYLKDILRASEDLPGEDEVSKHSESSKPQTKRKFSKAASRQRYKKGKG